MTRGTIIKAVLSMGLLLGNLVNVGYAQETTAPATPLRAEGSLSHVVHISVDALGSRYLEQFLRESPDEFPTLGRLVREGASTLNARTDVTHTNTLPNHTCMITGRPVKTPAEWSECQGHFWEWNLDFPSPDAPASLHALNPQGKDGYTQSAFDVAHDAGLKTALYAGKSKFNLYSVSYGPNFGAPHPNGRNKIDFSLTGDKIYDRALAEWKVSKPNYSFWNFAQADNAGHAFGYLGQEYRDAIKQVDGQIGQILAVLDADEAMKGRSAIILSADHGGEPGTKGHGNAAHPANFTIPFLVWGTGVKQGADLYALNPATRTDPGGLNPAYKPEAQPIRNGDGGNLALHLLGLPAISGSHINSRQDLAVR